MQYFTKSFTNYTCNIQNVPARYLVDGEGNIYNQSVEPDDKYAPNTMPVSHTENKNEHTKANYLVTANIPYLHYDEDLLNQELLPKPGMLFVGP